MNVAVLTDLREVQALVPAWRDLLADSAGDGPTMSPEWLLTWWDVFGGRDGRRLRFLTFHQNEQLIGLAPLLLRRHWYRPGLPFRRLEVLASGEREGDAICSDYLTVLARRGREEVVARAFVQALATGSAGGWDEFVVPLMAGDQAMPRLLADAARNKGLLADVEETTRAPYIPLPATWAEYLNRLGKKERYLINRSLRDFEAWAEGNWTLEQATLATLEEGKRTLHALHHERWDGSVGGVFRSPLFLTFHDRVMPRLLEAGALELLNLRVRDEPVAAMYNLRWERKTYFYQCGRKLDVPRHLRPGGVLIYLAIRRAIEAGGREFDFLGGEALYKKQLALASRPLLRLRVARPGVRERGLRLIEWGKAALRPLKQRLFPRRTGCQPVLQKTNRLAAFSTARVELAIEATAECGQSPTAKPSEFP